MVTREVKRLRGIIQVSFDLKTKTARVTYDPRRVGSAAILQAINVANALLKGENAPVADAERLLGGDPPKKEP